MGTCLEDGKREGVYISCLAYLAAEAEREESYVVAEILKIAISGIHDWVDHGEADIPVGSNTFVDSVTAAFAFILQHRALPQDKKQRMIGMLEALEHEKAH